jgi:hypothetical protein
VAGALSPRLSRRTRSSGGLSHRMSREGWVVVKGRSRGRLSVGVHGGPRTAEGSTD